MRMNINDYCRKNMNSVDIRDHLHSQYKIDHWMLKYKWWWKMFMCSRGVLVVNVYVVYNTECGLNSLMPMSHYEFHRQLVIIKLDPDGFQEILRVQVQNSAKGCSSTNHQRHQFINTIRKGVYKNNIWKLWRGVQEAQKYKVQIRIQGEYSISSFLLEHLCQMGT